MQETKGNGRLLILTDSQARPCDSFLTRDVLFNALGHMGLPFAVLDLAKTKLTVREAGSAAAIVIAQENGLQSLDAQAWKIVRGAVQNGAGLVNFDCRLSQAAAPVRSFLEIEPNDYPVYSDLLWIGEGDHYVARYKENGQLVKARHCVPVHTVRRLGPNWTVPVMAVLGKDQLIYTRHLIPGLRLEPSNVPAIACRDAGAGRAVQFFASPRLWLDDFLGHGRGFDDVFYRLFVWAARKPFAAKPVPPFVTMRVDDCSGTHAFHYIDVMSKFGYMPTIACFWDEIQGENWKRLKDAHDRGAVQLETHAFSYYDLLHFDFGKGEYTESRLREQFAKEDRILKEKGLTVSRSVLGHCNEIGAGALPFLKARGRTLLEAPYRLGEVKCERTKHPLFPYGSPQFGYDFLEEDKAFFRYFWLFSPVGASTADFLEGDALTWLGQSRFNNIDKAVSYGVSQLRQGLDAFYFSEIITHEQKLSVMTLSEIERMLKGIDEGMRRYERIYKPLDQIAAYLKGHRQSWLESVSVREQDIEYAVGGRPETPQCVRVYRGDDEGVLQTA